MGRKPANDPNLFAKRVFNSLLDKLDPEAAAELPSEPELSAKDPKAVAAGRKGGLKGGPARAAALSPDKRRKSAQHAAKTRWKAR
jgi:hypothetical protein